MLFWLNEKIEKNNTVILSKQAVLVGSCNRDSCKDVRAQLEKNHSPVKVFGKENLILIPLPKIQEITNQVKKPVLEIVVGMNSAGEERKLLLSFSDFDDREKCSTFLKKLRLSAIQNTGQKQKTKAKPAQPEAAQPIAKIKNLLARKKTPANPLKVASHQPLSSGKPFKYEEITLKHRLKEKKPLLYGLTIGAIVLASSLYLFSANPDSLYEAIQTQNITNKEIDSLLDKGADINYRGEDGVTPLLSAINQGKEKIIVSLVNKGADLTDKYNGETALDVAIASGLDNAAFIMLSKKAPTANQKDLLIRAIQNKLSTTSVKKIINLGADINYINENGSSVLATALMFTAKDEIIKLLLDKGASTNIKINGVPPAMFARTRGRKDLAKLMANYN